MSLDLRFPLGASLYVVFILIMKGFSIRLVSGNNLSRQHVAFPPIQFAYLPSQLFLSLWLPDKPVINSLAP